MSADREIYRLRAVEVRALAVVVAWDRLSSCQDEFYPESPGACGEYVNALDTAILDLMRIADPERWQRRQQVMREASENAIVGKHSVFEYQSGWAVVAPDSSIVVGYLPNEGVARTIAMEYDERRTPGGRAGGEDQ